VFEREVKVIEYVRQGPKLARDRLFEAMRDLRYHSAFELESSPGLGKGEWVKAMRELIERDYSFERLSMSLRLYRRKTGERLPILAELLRGIDWTIDENANLDGSKPVEPVQEELSVESDWEQEGEQDDEDGEEGDEEEVGESFVAGPILDDLSRLILSAKSSSGDKELMISAEDAVTMTFGILAKKNSGKTYLAMVMAEEFLRTRMPFVVVDPTGVWHGLRLDASGEPSVHRVLVMGGPRADVDMKPHDGEAAARSAIAIYPCPTILDISEMVPDEQYDFMAAFGQALYGLNRRPLHIFVDEADEFCPQQPSQHQKKVLGVWDRMVRRGRLRGIGLTLITQRSAVINKNVLSQIDGLFVLNTIAPPDLEAIETWMKRVVPVEERVSCLKQLPKLPQGRTFYMQGGGDHRFASFTVRSKTTFDTSKTPRMGQEDLVVPAFCPMPDEILDKVVLGQKPGGDEESEGEEKIEGTTDE
jgi:hypothetical protein